MDIIHTSIWDDLYTLIRSGENINSVSTRMYEIGTQYNMDIKHLLKDFVYYVWITYSPSIPIASLDIAFHHVNINPDHMLRHIILCLN